MVLNSEPVWAIVFHNLSDINILLATDADILCTEHNAFSG